MYSFNQKIHEKQCDKSEYFSLTLLARQLQQVAKKVIIVYKPGICKLEISNERNPAPYAGGATAKVIRGRSVT